MRAACGIGARRSCNTGELHGGSLQARRKMGRDQGTVRSKQSIGTHRTTRTRARNGDGACSSEWSLSISVITTHTTLPPAILRTKARETANLVLCPRSKSVVCGGESPRRRSRWSTGGLRPATRNGGGSELQRGNGQPGTPLSPGRHPEMI